MSYSITKNPYSEVVFPSHVRALAHPGIMTTLKTRRELDELLEKALKEFPAIMAQGYSEEDVGEIIYQKYFLSRFSHNDPAFRSFPYQSDYIAHDEACDYVEKNVLKTNLSKLKVAEVHRLFHEIHKRILDPSHPNLAQQPAGAYRLGHMVICKDVDVEFNDLVSYFAKQQKEAKGTPKEKEMSTKYRAACEIHQYARMNRMNFYKMMQDGAVSDAAKALFREFFVPCSSPQHIKQQLDELIEIMQKRLASGEDPISVAAYVHLEFCRIHPYPDANGRMARMLMNIILMQGRHQPIGFAFDDSYTEAIRADQGGKKGSFEAFIRRLVHQFDYEALPISVLAAINREPPKVDLTAGIKQD